MRRALRPGVAALLVLLWWGLFAWPGSVAGQGPIRSIAGGSGHWKIPSEDQGEWRVLDTLHFRIHYPAGREGLAERAAIYCEQSYARLSRVLGHRMRAAVPVFLFATHQDFAAANFFSGSPGESTGGYTDFFRRRVVVPFYGDYAALRHVLAHEIAHAFQFEILPGPFYNQYPLWLIEGMAEYVSLGWDASLEEYLRDRALHADVPTLRRLQSAGERAGYDNYKAGQAIFYFIAQRFGEERIGFFLKELAAAPNLRVAFESAFALAPEDFDFAYLAFVNARFAPAFQDMAAAQDPRVRGASFRYDPRNHLSDRSGFHLHPVIAPDGTRMAYITASGPFPAVAIKPVPGPGVSPDQVADVTIVLRALRSSDYETYQPLTTRLSWSPDGRQLLVAGRASGRQALLVIDVAAGEIVRRYTPLFDALQYPVFSRDGRRIVFTGVARGQADLYVLDVTHAPQASQTPPDVALTRLTRDLCYESDPQFSADGRSVFFSANCDAYAQTSGGDLVQRHIFRVDIPDAPGVNPADLPRITQVTRLPGRASQPQPGFGGSLVFSSDFTGVRNVYRIPAHFFAGPATLAGVGDIEALTRSRTGIEHAALTIVTEDAGDTNTARDAGETPPEYWTPPPAPGEYLVFTERQEGALELQVLPPGIQADGRRVTVPGDAEIITSVAVADVAGRSYDPGEYQMPIALETYDRGVFESPLPFTGGAPYEPALSFEGVPFIFIGGGQDADGQTRIAALSALRLADDTGDHQIFALAGYGESPPEWTADLRYSYLRYRPDFFVGAFRQSGAFPVATFFEFNLNSILYDPNFRVLDQDSYGLYGGAQDPLSKFSSVSLTLEGGHDEILFRPTENDQREQDDILTKYYSASFAYRFDNTVYGPYGPVDGQGLLVSYGIPLRPAGTEREVYALVGDYRLHHWFSNDSIFAVRAFAGGVGGEDATDYPFRIGGFSTVRGYDYQAFEGRYSFFANIEYRFPLIKYLLFGFPFDWSPGWIRGVFFFDGGGAFDDPKTWQAYESRNRATRDLYLSYGAGIHWENFLWFLFPGAVMKIEWATPYDLKVSESPRKWKGVFSIGFNF